MLFKKLACLRQIVADLRRQRLEIAKGHFITQLGEKTNVEVGAIKIPRKIKQVNFQQRSGVATQRRAITQIGDTGVTA